MTSILNSRGFTAWKNGRNPCQRMCRWVLQGRLLIAAVLIGIPSALFGIANKQSRNRGIRRLVILLAVPALTLAVVSHLDKHIPANATPLIIAIETFRHDTGHYPESLDKLIPKQLEKIPNVRFSLFEPPIIYRISDGIPYLAIPSAMGDIRVSALA